jgi:hypothetical protein
MRFFVITTEQFDTIKKKHGEYASWAVWTEATEKPKSNIGDMGIFDLDSNPNLTRMLKNNVVMVGLNISRPFSEPFRNFHDSNPRANDFKIRYAFQNTKYYGAYMTDIIKGLEMISSKDVLKHLKANPALIETNVNRFREELRDLKPRELTILAFGVSAYKIIRNELEQWEYSKLIRLTHYSHQINKEKYREKVSSQINCAREASLGQL